MEDCTLRKKRCQERGMGEVVFWDVSAFVPNIRCGAVPRMRHLL